MYTRRTVIGAVAAIMALALATIIVSPLAGATTTAQPAINVAKISATPNTISPIDVLTVSTTMTNNNKRVDGLTVNMVVRDQTGQVVLQQKQSGIGLTDRQSVYWEWRIPDRLTDGPYAIEMTVLDHNGQVLASGVKDAAFQVDRTEAMH